MSLQVAYWLLQHNVKVMMAACDTFRSGAVEQLRTHARRLQVSEIYTLSVLWSIKWGRDLTKETPESMICISLTVKVDVTILLCRFLFLRRAMRKILQL